MADVNDQHGAITCNDIENASESLGATQADRVAPITFKKRSATVPISPFARDPRYLDIENERNLSRGFLEGRKRNSDSANENRINGNAESKIKPPSLWRKIFKPWKKRSVRCLRFFPICENMIGEGGYGEVYKGCLRDGMLIAVKRLTKGMPEEITECFLIELGIAAHVDHPNTAKLIGCCIEGGMHLVFLFCQRGSLGSYLHGSKDASLDWSKRYKIAVGAADGLTYLHECCPRRIIHRDIKADNILLKEDFVPQICDFGLAKWLPSGLSDHKVSKYEGTPGYFAPEYIMHGIVNEKTDVYAFGVLLLELISGRKATNTTTKGLVEWAKPLLDNNDNKALLDPALGNDYDLEEVDRVLLTASLCIENSPILRPQMSQAVILLRGDDCASAYGRISEANT